MPASTATFAHRPAIKRTARIAAVCGWSYIVTIVGAFGAPFVPAGPLRVLLLNFGVLCVIIGVVELALRRFLLKTGEPRWARFLALNEVGGTLALFWSLYLLYQVPDAMLYQYSKTSEMWSQIMPILKRMPNGEMLTDNYLIHMWHNTKIRGGFGIGCILFLTQVWVIYRYLRLAKAIERESAIPPILK